MEVTDIDIYSPAFQQNIYSYYPLFYSKGPVWLPLSKCWLVTGYNDVKQVLSDTTAFSSKHLNTVDSILLGADGLQHAVNKKVVAQAVPAFRREQGVELSAHAEKVAAALIRNFTLKAESNVIHDLVNPFSFYVALQAVGIHQLPQQLQLSGDISELNMNIQNINRLFNNWRDMLDVIALNIDKAAVGSQIAAIIDGFSREGNYRKEELIKFFKLLMTAGIETTASLIASSVYYFYSDSTVRNEVMKGEEQVIGILNEVLRIYSPAQFTFRTATQSAALSGAVMEPGQVVAVCVGAANRDPAVFEQPDNFIINRTERHIAFGNGSHRCIGEHLAMYTAKTFLQHFKETLAKTNYTGNMQFGNSLFTMKISEVSVRLNG